MDWPEDLARELPAPRTDEPPELRRRIIAELRDHLHTDWQRELLRTGDAERARRNVLIRFGDPARLARKLWFDAMREKIMMQRGMLVALLAMVLVSAGSLGLTWFVVAQAGQVNQALLEQNRAVNQSLLARLEALGRAPAETAAKSTEWSPLKFRVTWD
jgi:HAAS